MKTQKIFLLFLMLLFSCKNRFESRDAKLENIEVCSIKVDLSVNENKIIVPSSYLLITEKDIKANFNVEDVKVKIIGGEVALSQEEYVPLKIAVVDAKLKKIVGNYVFEVKKAKCFNITFEASSLIGHIKAEVDGKILMSPAMIDEGKEVKFYAVLNDSEFRVEKWQKDGVALDVYSDNYTTTINSDINISVEFKRGRRVVYNPNPSNGKIEVKYNGNVVAVGKILDKEASLEIKAIANDSYIFGYWIINGRKKLDDLDYKSNKLNITLDEDIDIDSFISTQGTMDISESKTDQMQELHINGIVSFPLHYGDSKLGVVEKSFAIGKYEVTYNLWNEVLEWAIQKGYSIASAKGSKGSYYNDGSDGKKKGMHENIKGSNQQPVTVIDYRSIIVWCNAYSEKMGRTPVYYSDAQFKNIIKMSDDGEIDTSMGTQDNPYINIESDGYRLASLSEWEFVARLNPTIGSEDRVVKVGSETWHFLPFDYASGATYRVNNIDGLKKVAWFEDNSQIDGKEQTHEVGKLQPNAVGCFDMSGNVYELVEDWSEKNISRFIKGGSFSAGNQAQAIGIYNGMSIEDSLRGVGFRLSRTLK